MKNRRYLSVFRHELTTGKMHLSHSFLFNHPILGLIVFNNVEICVPWSKHSTASGMVLDPITKNRLRFWAYNPTFDSDSGGGGSVHLKLW